MSDVPIDEEIGFSTLTTLSRCPACHAPDLEVILDGTGVNFYCTSCFRCWHLELNRVIRVDPATCSGCIHACACSERFAADHDSAPIDA